MANAGRYRAQRQQGHYRWAVLGDFTWGSFRVASTLRLVSFSRPQRERARRSWGWSCMIRIALERVRYYGFLQK